MNERYSGNLSINNDISKTWCPRVVSMLQIWYWVLFLMVWHWLDYHAYAWLEYMSPCPSRKASAIEEEGGLRCISVNWTHHWYPPNGSIGDSWDLGLRLQPLGLGRAKVTEMRLSRASITTGILRAVGVCLEHAGTWFSIRDRRKKNLCDNNELWFWRGDIIFLGDAWIRVRWNSPSNEA